MTLKKITLLEQFTLKYQIIPIFPLKFQKLKNLKSLWKNFNWNQHQRYLHNYKNEGKMNQRFPNFNYLFFSNL